MLGRVDRQRNGSDVARGPTGAGNSGDCVSRAASLGRAGTVVAVSSGGGKADGGIVVAAGDGVYAGGADRITAGNGHRGVRLVDGGDNNVRVGHGPASAGRAVVCVISQRAGVPRIGGCSGVVADRTVLHPGEGQVVDLCVGAGVDGILVVGAGVVGRTDADAAGTSTRAGVDVAAVRKSGHAQRKYHAECRTMLKTLFIFDYLPF